MHRMLATARAKLFQLDPIGIVTAIFLRRVIAFFAIATCQRNYWAYIFGFTSHDSNTFYFLINNFRNHTRAHGQAAFANCKFGTFF
jgi:hypothetical protein